jgi:acetyltransferase-like isoleucine patch superfamily enzyme
MSEPAKLSKIALTIDVRIQHHLGTAAPRPALSGQGLRLQTEGMPEWWIANGNALYAPAPPVGLSIQPHPGLPPPINAMIVFGPEIRLPDVLLLWGEAPLIFVGQGTALPSGVLNCGGGSSIIIGEKVECTAAPTLNARNGGLICIEGKGLWSSRITMFTDDMHTIMDAKTGKRVNRYGGCIHVKSHVWLGFDVMLLAGASIGEDSVVGPRAVVNGPLPSGSVCVGAPARAVRSDITWSSEDIRPDDHQAPPF